MYVQMDICVYVEMEMCISGWSYVCMSNWSCVCQEGAVYVCYVEKEFSVGLCRSEDVCRDETELCVDRYVEMEVCVYVEIRL